MAEKKICEFFFIQQQYPKAKFIGSKTKYYLSIMLFIIYYNVQPDITCSKKFM